MNVKKLLNAMNVTARRVRLGDLIDGKVDKVSGKGLSTNDFTDTYKSKLDAIIEAETSGSGGTE